MSALLSKRERENGLWFALYDNMVLLYYKWDTLALLITVYLTWVQMFNYKERPHKDMPFALYSPIHIFHYTHRWYLSHPRKSRQPHNIRHEVFPTTPTTKWNVWQQYSDGNIRIYFIHFNKYQRAQGLFYIYVRAGVIGFYYPQ